MSYYAEILPNQETTIQYRFRTDFEPAELGLVVDLSVVDEVLNLRFIIAC